MSKIWNFSRTQSQEVPNQQCIKYRNIENNLFVKSVGIKLLFQVSWHFLLLARLFIIRELILIFVSLTIRFDCGVHFAFIYLFRSSVCGICNLTINEKNGLKMHLNSIFDTQMNWKDIEPPFMYCVFHHISGHFPGQIKFWSILIKKLGMGQTPRPLVGTNSQLNPKFASDY